MADLNNKKPSATFHSLLNVGTTDNQTLDGTLRTIEDGLSEDDWVGWENLTTELGKNMQLVGDDLFVTNIERLQRGIDNKIANSIALSIEFAVLVIFLFNFELNVKSLLVRITLTLFSRGRLFSGMEPHVFLPIITILT